MPRIHILDEETVSRIAAGEVIERPASVVKELIENSIDAGASRIIIEVENGGISLIKLVDDGCGIEREDLPLAFQRHATSKISTADDLFRLKTLGFRGEALSAIASVSKCVEVHTRTRYSPVGTYLRLENGRVAEIKDDGCPYGTSIEVRGLFETIPARLKHLSSPSQELARIAEIVTQMAIIHHRISFELSSGRRTLFRSNASETWDDALIRAFGLRTAKGMISIIAEGDGFDLHGMISSHDSSHHGSELILVYVNSRPVYSKVVVQALREAYRGFLQSGRSPLAVISIEIEPSLVDVNVHPAKREVRFLREDEVYDAVRDAALSALRSSAIPSPPPPARIAEPQLWSAKPQIQRTLPLEVQAEQRISEPLIRIVGQALDLYIIVEDDDGIMLVDQHAAAERIRYEHLLEKCKSGSISQELIQPVTVELSPGEVALLDSFSGELGEIGFEIDPFGGRAYSVRSVPAAAGLESPESIRDVLREILNLGRVCRASFRDEALKHLACRGSIKSGERLSESAMLRLLTDLFACDNPRTCPHGRPVVVRISSESLEKMFGRR
ncbi:MAG: DNA mismatch repair endonuclease MutL [Methanothrix sp.]|uniref:DNA mismatch repair protein MutL n=1 Tax=Methanothrix thermoacetophila (strain DSM 6194 / JCM 14653 / NBRC 101360 / PT) TaxID=349307 RepID=MUTL_METTP|nr:MULTISPECIES: DNA mismatch repair endonuclease MutL [Methanothrix]A0B977.1 RecName: Full=DNA mismatch repair protein MutL [Methanothrix thermoacetophila PT]ABK15251.1 DNA mismatch repair protein MutL [Methanothrix thermoacetophila PT]MBC7079162.1 DNA mismatch repair endonuclease MutL [Methanothrix sp.]NPU86626.1 DNA mismatch repair endonuclease MutL [Methanothrix sp.]